MMQEFETEHARLVQGWSLKKEISLGDVVAIVVALSSVLGAYIAIDRRVTILETVQGQMILTDARIEHDTLTLREEIKQDLKDIKIKLDQINDRTLRGLK